MEHIELFMKFAPVYDMTYWNIFYFLYINPKRANTLREYLYIRIEIGANKFLL